MSATGGHTIGTEVDIVVEDGRDGSVVGIEVKSGSRIHPKDRRGVRTLRGTHSAIGSPPDSFSTPAPTAFATRTRTLASSPCRWIACGPQRPPDKPIPLPGAPVTVPAVLRTDWGDRSMRSRANVAVGRVWRDLPET